MLSDHEVQSVSDKRMERASEGMDDRKRRWRPVALTTRAPRSFPNLVSRCRSDSSVWSMCTRRNRAREGDTLGVRPCLDAICAIRSPTSTSSRERVRLDLRSASGKIHSL